MDQAAESWKKFYVHMAGKTNDAHLSLVSKLEDIGHIKVDYPQQSDYILVFCPIASRVGTDISEAEDSMPSDKPVILVVMHHTFDREHVVAESSRQVNHPNVRLTVDCLFYENRLLKCNRNDIAWFDIQKILGVSASQVSANSKCNRICLMKYLTVVSIGILLILVLTFFVIVIKNIQL